MKISVFVPCKCGEEVKTEIGVKDTTIGLVCPKCGQGIIGSLDPNFHIGHRLLEYSANAFEKKDYNFSILLSAMAMDCYLSRLYYKWRDIEELKKDRPYDASLVKERVLTELQKINDFIAKIGRVEKLIYSKGIVDFIRRRNDIRKEIREGFKSINIDNFSKVIRNEVMWRRNNIVHSGMYIYNKEDAIKCHNYSKLFIKVLDKMDAEKSANPI